MALNPNRWMNCICAGEPSPSLRRWKSSISRARMRLASPARPGEVVLGRRTGLADRLHEPVVVAQRVWALLSAGRR